MMVQHIKQLQEHLGEIQSQLNDLNVMKNSLDELNSNKGEKEGLFSFGKGIFVKGKYSGNSEVVVNVGSNVCVTKSVEGAKELIDKQIVEMEKLSSKMQSDAQELMGGIAGLQKELQ